MNDYNSEKVFRNKIMIISFVCSLFVIWIHTYNVEYYGISANSTGLSGLVWKMETFWADIIRIAVPTFFFVSGFLGPFQWIGCLKSISQERKVLFCHI